MPTLGSALNIVLGTIIMETKPALLDHKTDITLTERLLPWQKRGLQYTASGYGTRIPTRWIVNYAGRTRRVYCTIYSNAGSCWIVVDGKKRDIA